MGAVGAVFVLLLLRARTMTVSRVSGVEIGVLQATEPTKSQQI